MKHIPIKGFSQRHQHAFGMVMPERSFSNEKYRWGFNGKETDNETKWQDYGFRIYYPGLAKFLSVDPLNKKYPELTPYQFASNSPIWAVDLDGLEAWPVTRQWNSADLKGFAVFAQNEIQRIKETQASGKGKRLDIEYNCADLAVALYVRYAAANGLPVTFKVHSGNVIDANDPKQYHYNPSDPQKSVDKFEKDARMGTSAASLVYNKDALNVEFTDLSTGDFHDNKSHTMVVRDPYSGEVLRNGEKAVSYGNVPHGSNDSNDPLWGTKELTESVIGFSNENKQMFYRFKELYNGAQNTTPPEVPSKLTPSSPSQNNSDCTDE